MHGHDGRGRSLRRDRPADAPPGERDQSQPRQRPQERTRQAGALADRHDDLVIGEPCDERVLVIAVVGEDVELDEAGVPVPARHPRATEPL
jgi:hypothetical protein